MSNNNKDNEKSNSTEAIPKIKQAVKWIIDNKWLAAGATVFAVVFTILIVLLAGRIADQQAYQDIDAISTPPGQEGSGMSGNGVTAPDGQTPATGQENTGQPDSGVTPPSGQGNTDDPAGGATTAPAGQETDPGSDATTSPPGGTDSNPAGGAANPQPGGTGSNPNTNPNPAGNTITLPAGQTDFSIELRVNEPEAYAGIEFALTLSDEDAQNFYSFKPELSGAIASPFVTVGGKHYFGFLAGSNAFPAGDSLAGTINFTGYSSDKTLTITIVEMSVVRLDDNNKATETIKDSPAYVFTVKR